MNIYELMICMMDDYWNCILATMLATIFGERISRLGLGPISKLFSFAKERRAY